MPNKNVVYMKAFKRQQTGARVVPVKPKAQNHNVLSNPQLHMLVSDPRTAVTILRARAHISSLRGVIPVQSVLSQRVGLRGFNQEELIEILKNNEDKWGARATYFTAVIEEIMAKGQPPPTNP